MELLGTHKVTFDHIRSLAIQCHALDITAYHLFMDSTHEDKSKKTMSTYQDLMTEKLLGLAIALRTKFYQGLDHNETVRYVGPCGLMFKHEGNVEKNVAFSMKDVCDKVIHADNVSRHLEDGVEKPTTSLQGQQAGTEWELSMSVSLFAEAVLNWVQDVEEAAKGEAKAKPAVSVAAKG